MKLSVMTNEAEKSEFPKLVFGNIFEKKQIILATGTNKEHGTFIGTNVNGIGHPIGYYSERWDGSMSEWNGSVTISFE